MRLRSVRLTLFVLFAVAVAAATYQAILIDQQMEAERTALRGFEADAQAASVTLAELQSAQQAYVAVGQTEAFWFARVAGLLEDLNGRLDALQARARGPAVELLADAEATLGDFARMDARARDLVRADQRLLASDLIFADGLELLAAAGSKIDESVAAQTAEVRQTLVESRQSVLWVIVAALAVSMFVILLLLPRVPAAPAVTNVRIATEGSDARRDEGLSELGGLTLRSAEEAGQAPTPARTEADVDLQAASTLCTDLGRVTTLPELPALLERAARLLDASGLVVWLGDGPDQALRPVIAHGYTSQILARMGTIPRDSESATAAAYRGGRTRIVKGNAVLEGAIVAPLVTSAGCIGVMAAEIRGGRESSPDVQAVAGILAAQLATVVSVDSSGSGAADTQQQASR